MPEKTIQMLTLQICENHFVIVASRQQIVSAGREANGANIGCVWFEALQGSGASNVIQYTG